MNHRVVASFDVTGWDETPYDEAGPRLARATLRKTYRGALEAEAVAELLMCQADPADYAKGAGYVASERVRGTLDGREGSFVLQHGGVSGDGQERSFGHVVPGSGTEELAGLRGTATIANDPDRGHTLTLDYELG